MSFFGVIVIVNIIMAIFLLIGFAIAVFVTIKIIEKLKKNKEISNIPVAIITLIFTILLISLFI